MVLRVDLASLLTSQAAKQFDMLPIDTPGVVSKQANPSRPFNCTTYTRGTYHMISPHHLNKLVINIWGWTRPYRVNEVLANRSSLEWMQRQHILTRVYQSERRLPDVCVFRRS